MSELRLLRAAGTALLIDVEGPRLPRVLQWGADPGPLEPPDLKAMAAALVLPIGNSALDDPWTPSLLATEDDGWAARPGISGWGPGGACLRLRLLEPVTVTDRPDGGAELRALAAVAEVVAAYGSVDVLVSNAGIQIVHPVEEFPFSDWKKMLAIHLDGAFLTTKACVPHMQASGKGGSIIYMGSVHSKEASVLKSAYVTAKHGLIGLCKTVAKEGGRHGIRANVICPGFVRTPLVEKQIPEQAKALGISEDDVIKKVMLKETVDGEFTTVQDVAEVALLFAGFGSSALTGQSLVVSHGWFMQ